LIAVGCQKKKKWSKNNWWSNKFSVLVIGVVRSTEVSTLVFCPDYRGSQINRGFYTCFNSIFTKDKNCSHNMLYW